jgi:predicted RNA-binding protein with PIN domain
MLQLLIDGHNLIGQMPGLRLSDFDDETKLVELLRQYAARRSRRSRSAGRVRMVVVFDSGSPGGRSAELSGGGLEVIFAADGHTTADRILIERMRKARRPRAWTLVSSDHEVQKVARKYRIPVLEAAEFAMRLTPQQATPPVSKTEVTDKPDREDDVAGWLKLFEEE